MATYNIEIREFNGVTYDVLYPVTTIDNVSGLNDRLTQLNNNISSVSSRVTTNQNNINTLAGRTSAVETNIRTINSNIQDLNDDISNMQDSISDISTFDTTTTAGSDHPVTSNGIKVAIDTMASTKLPLNPSSIELIPASATAGNGGFIDFHYNGSAEDYTSRIIEEEDYISIIGKKLKLSSGVLEKAYGGTGNANGTIDKLTTARAIQTNLASTSTELFDGSANVTPGVTGILPVAHGGTNANNAKDALTNLGIIISNTAISEGGTLASGSIYIYYE